MIKADWLKELTSPAIVKIAVRTKGVDGGEEGTSAIGPSREGLAGGVVGPIAMLGCSAGRGVSGVGGVGGVNGDVGGGTVGVTSCGASGGAGVGGGSDGGVGTRLAAGDGGGNVGEGSEGLCTQVHMTDAPLAGQPAWPFMPCWQQKLELPQQAVYAEPEQEVEPE